MDKGSWKRCAIMSDNVQHRAKNILFSLLTAFYLLLAFKPDKIYLDVFSERMMR